MELSDAVELLLLNQAAMAAKLDIITEFIKALDERIANLEKKLIFQ